MTDKQPHSAQSPTQAEETGSHANLAESPWFWMALFAAIGILGLLVISPKYGTRQARMEQRYQHRLKVRAMQGAATDDASEPARDDQQDFSNPEPPPATAWPLVAATGAALVVAIAGLVISRAKRRSGRHPGATGSA